MKSHLLLLVTLLAAAPAAATPRPTPTFTATTSFEGCSKSWAFACGMLDANGSTYGTAKEMTHCERYVFQPDGTFKNGFETGTYKIVKNMVVMRLTSQPRNARSFELALSVDHSTLGTLKRLAP